MRRGWWFATLHRVTRARGGRIRLVLEIAPDTEPVSGWIGPPLTDGAGRDFLGWTELAAAIEQLRRGVEREDR